MYHKILDINNQQEITDLFRSTFTGSEGEKEGQLIGNLVTRLCSDIDNQDIICFGAYDQGLLIGSIFFTRVQFEQPTQVYMLAPVAIDTLQQGKGVGQSLINYGLSEMKKRAVEVVVTYGDPAFYSRVGFQALSEHVIQAPLTLSMPIGWQGLSLTEKPIEAIKGHSRCVDAFNDPVYW
ncbi:GNAT family N-acetyltransferase [Marinicella sp. W31]|uniref:GNAT family N-acetyltransferase n=1 Tax=Marinicella sp. W31 TaxID=3023713 RepID=UPI0037577C48